jgi:hypothetical protein
MHPVRLLCATVVADLVVQHRLLHRRGFLAVKVVGWCRWRPPHKSSAKAFAVRGTLWIDRTLHPHLPGRVFDAAALSGQGVHFIPSSLVTDTTFAHFCVATDLYDCDSGQAWRLGGAAALLGICRLG